MRVQSLQLWQYRNISHLELECPQELHLFVGPNAQGKTNILESLYLLSLGKSHRSRSTQELIQFGKQQARLKANVIKKGQPHRLEIQLLGKGKKVSRNGIEQPRLSQYIGFLPAVLFAPEDLALVKGSPQVRRRFLDMEIGQVSRTYVYQLSQLTKLIVQRNHLLKKIHQDKKLHLSLLDVLNEQLVALVIPIWKKRFHFLRMLTTWAKEIHQTITENREELMIEYVPSIRIHQEMSEEEMKKSFLSELSKIQEKEIQRGSTLIGPQRDDFRLISNQLDLHIFGSQGQQRTAALSLKLAEIELIYQEMGVYPILLLDDVLSELDDSRKTHLLTAIQGRVQTFVTTTSLEGISSTTLDRAQVYQVRQGIISEQR